MATVLGVGRQTAERMRDTLQAMFQEEPSDVPLRFLPEAAGNAERWRFHPTQNMKMRLMVC